MIWLKCYQNDGYQEANDNEWSGYLDAFHLYHSYNTEKKITSLGIENIVTDLDRSNVQTYITRLQQLVIELTEASVLCVNFSVC